MRLSDFKKLVLAGVELKKLFVGGIQVWKNGYKNWVPVSTDTDGSIYNGAGYIDGYRLSSSGSLKIQDNTVTTGFIKATKNDVVRMAGTKWNECAGYNYFAIYDDNYNLIDTLNYDGYGDASTHGWSFGCSDYRVDEANTYVYVEDGITRFDIAMNANYDYAYIRISAYGSGEEMIITVNEEIID